MKIIYLLPIFILFSCNGGGGGGGEGASSEVKSGEGNASESSFNLEGVYKYYSVYASSTGDIESGRKSLPPIVHLFKRDGTFKSCAFDELKNKLDEEVSKDVGKFKIDNNMLVISDSKGEKFPFEFKRLSDTQIELSGEIPLGVGTVGIRGISVVLEKTGPSGGMGLDDYFIKSCNDLVPKTIITYPKGSGYETLDKFKSAVANNQWGQNPSFASYNYYKFNYRDASSTNGCTKVGSGIFSFNYCLNQGTATPVWVTEEKKGVITNPLISLTRIKDIVNRAIAGNPNSTVPNSGIPYAYFQSQQWTILLGSETFVFNPAYPLGANPTYYKNSSISPVEEYSLANYEYSVVTEDILPQNITGNISAYLNANVCSNGRIPEVTFSANQFNSGSGNTTEIQGNLSLTPIGGSPSNTYVGVNLGTKDVIVITRMISGGKEVGFNISLSLCRDIRRINTEKGSINLPIFDQSRMPSVEKFDPIILTDLSNCSMGSVDRALIYLNIPAYKVPNTNDTIPATQLPVSFTKVNCL